MNNSTRSKKPARKPIVAVINLNIKMINKLTFSAELVYSVFKTEIFAVYVYTRRIEYKNIIKELFFEWLNPIFDISSIGFFLKKKTRNSDNIKKSNRIP